jgi:chondroitin 4-sulfotransferase 11
MIEVIRKIIYPLYRLFPLLLRLEISNRFVYPYWDMEDANKVIFVHIPKAAGNGVTKSIFGCESNGHYTWKAYARDNVKFREYYKFAVVRNPYDRFISAYDYLKRGGFGDYDLEFREKYIMDMTIDSFCEKIMSNKCFRKKILCWIHFKPQVEYIFDGEELKVDDVYKLENLADEFHLLCERIGRESLCFKKENVNSRSESKISDVVKECVQELYAQDFEYLNYCR